MGTLALVGGSGGDEAADSVLPRADPTGLPTATPPGGDPEAGTTPDATAVTPEPRSTLSAVVPTPRPTVPFVLDLRPLPVLRGRSPLTGLPAPEDITTRVLAVKIDNHVNARPQSGIEKADMMIEIWVEGITRFISLWEQSDSDFVGPIRSMRPTDFAMLNALSATFVNSGGQSWVQAIGNATDVAWFQEPPGSFRISGRYAPHNLYGATTALRGLDGRGDYPEPLAPLWSFGPASTEAPSATEIFTSWPAGYSVVWTWNGSSYDRTTQGRPHMYLRPDGTANRVSTNALVMLEMSIYTAAGSTGSAVPASQTTGSGAAWVFASGRVQRGTWQRDVQTEWFTLTAADGTAMPVPPGRIWLVLPPPGGVAFS